MTRRNENKIMKTYLEEIMNSRVFKFFQGYVITHGHVLVNHNLLKPFPSKIFILKKVHGNSSRRLRRVQIMNLDGRLLKGRRDNRIGLDDPRLGQPVLCLLISSTIGKISQINHLG